jgi:hypothetical protein
MDFAWGFAASALHGLLMLAVVQLRLRLPALAVQVAVATLVQGTVAVALGRAAMLGSYWHFASAFAFGFMLYLFYFSALYKSVSLSVLVEIRRQPGGQARLDAVLENVIRRSFAQRAEALLALGAAQRAGSGYVATENGRRIARRIRALRRLLGFTRGGGIYFEAPDR